MKYYIENPHEKDLYIFNFIFHSCGIKGELVEYPTDAILIYGNKTNHNSSKQLFIQRKKSDVIWEALLNNGPNSIDYNDDVKFDVINAIGFFLTDQGNRNIPEESYDQHQRVKYNSSFQSLNGIGQVPIVNLYIQFLKALFKLRLGIDSTALFPEGKKSCIILSHDVDNPGKYDHLYNYRIFPKTKNIKSFYRHYRSLITLLKAYLTDNNKDEFWVFKEMIDLEKKYGFSSTCFFAATNFQSDLGHALDVPYKISHKRIKSIIKELLDNGFDVGLHAGYDAFRKLDSFVREKKEVERAKQDSIIGLRHHFWHLGPDFSSTLKMHEEAGFLYDSSIAFNDHLGFRYSTALPFYPYDSDSDKVIKVLQIPSFCLDGNLYNNYGLPISQAVKEFSDQVDIIRNVEGVGAIDWHVRTSVSNGSIFDRIGKAYTECLEILASHEDVWVTDFQTFYNWWESRASKLK